METDWVWREDSTKERAIEDDVQVSGFVDEVHVDNIGPLASFSGVHCVPGTLLGTVVGLGRILCFSGKLGLVRSRPPGLSNPAWMAVILPPCRLDVTYINAK